MLIIGKYGPNLGEVGFVHKAPIYILLPNHKILLIGKKLDPRLRNTMPYETDLLGIDAEPNVRGTRYAGG